MGNLNEFPQIDTERAWMNVYRRLENDGLIPEQHNGFHGYRLRRILAYAATVIILTGLGWLIYNLIPERGVQELITLRSEADNSTYVQTLEDGSIVYMADNTIINYPESFTGRERKIFMSGEAFFDIARKTDSPFLIETDHALIEVLGTAFNLKSFGNDFEIIVEEGTVKVNSKAIPGSYEVLTEWEMLKGVGASMEKLPVIDRTYLSWRTNRMQFRDEKLENIALIISKNYNVYIDFDDEMIKERRLTVTFHNNAINTIAEVISVALGLDFEVVAGEGILFSDKQ